MGAAIDWTAALVRATSGIFSTYDDRERAASPLVILLPESYT